MKPSRQTLCLALLGTLFASGAPAQQPGSSSGGPSFLADQDELPAQMVNRAEESAREYIAAKGWNEGMNPNGRYVAIGIGTIAVDPDQSIYQVQRQNAFEKAMLDAKRKIVQFFSTEIETAVQQDLAGGNPDAFAEATREETPEPVEPDVLDKMRMIFDSELDRELERRGIQPDSPQAEQVAARIPEESSRFRNMVSTVAESQVGALLVSKIFEQDKNIAVVAYYSPTTKELARAMSGAEPAPKVPAREGATLGAWVNGLGISQLYPTFGVQLHADENGNIAILSFGQAIAETATGLSRKRATEQANLARLGAIRRFIGEAVAYNSASETLEKISRFNEEELESINETVSESSISAFAESRNVPGIQTVRTWQTQDQRSGTYLIGVVNRWDIASANQADAERADFSEADGGSTGSFQPSSGASESQGTSGPNRTNTGIGEGETEATESIPSMDF